MQELDFSEKVVTLSDKLVHESISKKVKSIKPDGFIYDYGTMDLKLI